MKGALPPSSSDSFLSVGHSRHQLRADLGGNGKGELAHRRVGGELGTERALLVHVEHSSGAPHSHGELGHGESRERGCQAGLGTKCTAGECGGGLAGDLAAGFQGVSGRHADGRRSTRMRLSG